MTKVKYQTTGHRVIDSLISDGIKTGSVICLIYDPANHGVNLIENLAVNNKSRYITTSRTDKEVKDSLEDISDKSIEKTVRIVSTNPSSFIEDCIEECDLLENENLLIEDFGSMINIYSSQDSKSRASLYKFVKKIRNDIKNKDKVLFLGINRLLLEKDPFISSIVGTSDGVIELKNMEENSIQAHMVIRRLPSEEGLPRRTTVDINDELSKAGEEDLDKS